MKNFRTKNGIFTGDVGIGTTSPSYILHVLEDNSAVYNPTGASSTIYQQGIVNVNTSADTGAFLSLSSNSNQTGTSVIGSIGGSNAKDSQLVFLTRDGSATGDPIKEHMRIDSSGNVGIGTTSPSAKLDVLDNDNSIQLSVRGRSSDSFGIIDFKNNAGTASKGMIKSDASNNLMFRAGPTNDVLTMTPDGNVGIGTTSPADGLLHLKQSGNDAIRLQRTDAGANNGNIYLGHSGGGFSISTSGAVGVTSADLHIDSDGNVGIGTTNPAQKLDVYGNIAVNGVTVHTSDDRVKHNEQTIVGALETLSKITPKKYIKTVEMYDANHDFELDADGNPIDSNGEPVEHRIEAGVIAQQVLKVDELAFAVSPEGVDEDGTVTSPHGLDYNSLFTYAIAAIQEQQQTIEDLKSQNESLAARISALES